MNERLSSVEAAKNALMERLSGTDGVVINTPAENSAPHIINFSVPGVKAEVLLHMLEEKEYMSPQPRHVRQESTNRAVFFCK